ncbi:MAG TPA: extracellular solute-binding protein [Acetobacteraceae bacterium]|nr:extracellular solute-binding protein [Acetobacteraceae bacterium]
MTVGSPPRHDGLLRRETLALAGAAAVAAIRPARADTKLAIWTGFPEIQPVYQAVAAEYAKTHPGISFEFFSTSLREAEQKLTAAVPTGTGPDIYDIGSNISVNFIDNGLIDPNPPEIDAHLKSGVWDKFTVGFFTIDGKTYGLPFLEGSRACMYWNKAYFTPAGIAAPPATFPELIEDAKKLVQIDSQGRMTRSGISLRLSGQGSGIGEKFRYVLEAAGGSLLDRTPGGKWHNDYDNQAGREALTFYVDAVQTWHIDDPKVPHDADAFASGATAMLFREAWVIGDIQSKNPKLEYGVTPIPAWKAGSPRMMLLQPWGVYVNGQSSNKAAAWDFVTFLTNAQNGLRLTEMTGWLSPRQDIDWKPLLAKTPQFAAFVSPPSDVKYYVEPVLTAFDEIESRLADRLAAAYVDPSLKGNPQKIAATVHDMAQQTDQILKDAKLYGTA